MSNTQKVITITSEKAVELFGTHYFVNNGIHEEDFNLSIEQKIGPKSNFERDVNTLEEAIELHDEILKQHCKNAISRYKKSSKSIKGEVLYFLHKQNWLKKSRQSQIDEYLKIVEEARKLLSTGKKPVFKPIAAKFIIPEFTPKVGQVFYVVENELTKDFFKIDKYTVEENSLNISSNNSETETISINSVCKKENSDKTQYIQNGSILNFNGEFYKLGYDSKAFLKFEDAQKYSEQRLLEVIEQAKSTIENNKNLA